MQNRKVRQRIDEAKSTARLAASREDPAVLQRTVRVLALVGISSRYQIGIALQQVLTAFVKSRRR